MKILIIAIIALGMFAGCAPAAEVTYTGEGNGYAGPVVVEVTMQGSKIVKIEVVSSEDTPGLSTQAFEVMIDRIVTKQGVDVDTVSGATASSRGLLQAVEDAIAKSK